MKDYNGKQVNAGDKVRATGRGAFSMGEYVVVGADEDAPEVRVIIRSVTPDPDFGVETASAYSDEIVKA